MRNVRDFAGTPERLSSRPRGAAGTLLLAGLFSFCAPHPAWSLSESTVEAVERAIKGKVFRLRSNFHHPSYGGKPAPYLDRKGWHYRQRTRPILLYSGEEVEVTGIYTYGDRSIFLEIARPAGPEMLGFRQRVRFRVMVEAEEDKPEKQYDQLRNLIFQAISPVEPLEWPEPGEEVEPAGDAPDEAQEDQP